MAETNIPPALNLKELIASYPKLSPDSPSSWFVWSDNPDIPAKSYTAMICHADMRYTKAGYDYLVTAVPKADKASLQYLRMLIHGPFKAFSDLISLVRTKEGWYIQCSELKKWPSPVLFNFCIASRVPYEFEGQLTGWFELLDEGYPEVLAFLLSHSVGGGKFKHRRHYPEHGHYWFDPSSDWKKIINGSPNLDGLKYHQFPHAVTPSNAIWGKSDDCYVIRNLDNTKAAEHFGFKFPPKREKALKYPNKLYWQDEVPQPVGLVNMAAAHNALNNAMGMQQAPNGAWAQVAQAIHDEGQLQPVNPQWMAAQPYIAIDPIDDDQYHDEFPDFDEDADD